MHHGTVIGYRARVGGWFGLLAVAAAACGMSVGGGGGAEPVAAVGGGDAVVDGIIQQKMAEAGIVGVGAAVVVGNEIAWSRGYGHADRASGRAFTPDTVMNIASVSKTVLGAAMMQAVESGVLSLDADINTYLPFRVVNPHQPSATITLRHLATHTSGITDRREVYAGTYHYGGDSPESLGAFLERYFVPGGSSYSPDNFLKATPGSQREYSNIGAGLAGYIVERATGVPLNVYTREHIFVPLGMTRTGWFLSEVDRGNHSTLYVAQNGLTIPIPLYGGTTYPDGGVRTSVADLSKFFAAMLRGGAYGGVRILGAEAAKEMVRFQFGDDNRPENFPATAGNSGLFWRTKFSGKRVGHGGRDPGVHTEMLADPNHEIGVVLFVNTSLSGDEQEAVSVIFDAVWKHAEKIKSEKRATPRK